MSKQITMAILVIGKHSSYFIADAPCAPRQL